MNVITWTFPDWNNPNRSIPLAVGLMHTHYPLTWAKAGFRTDVGPSSTDKSPNQELPGLVYVLPRT